MRTQTEAPDTWCWLDLVGAITAFLLLTLALQGAARLLDLSCGAMPLPGF